MRLNFTKQTTRTTILLSFAPMSELLDYYSNKISEYTTQISDQNKKFNTIFYFRSFLFILTIVVALFFYKTNPKISLSVIPFTVIIFLYLLNLEIRLKRKTEFLKNLIFVNQIEIQLLNKNFQTINEGNEFIDKQHNFLSDLDIFGKRSIFQLLNRTATYTGRIILAKWLTHPFLDKEKINKRQTAIKDLEKKTEWNLHFIALGIENKEKPNDKEIINNWLHEENNFTSTPLKIAGTILPAATITALGMYGFGLIGITYFNYLFLFQLIIIGSQTKKINKIHDSLSRRFDSIEKYRLLITAIESEKFSSAELIELQQGLKNGETNASTHIKNLKSYTDKLDARMNIVIAVLLNGIFLWDINIMQRIEKWRSNHKNDFIKWITTIGEFDAYTSLALYAHNNPNYSYPEVETDTFTIEANDIGHPLIIESNLIKNNYHISGLPKIDLLTGANMAGKSTFLRTIGVNLTLAMIGAPVCASKFKFTPILLFTSLRTNDSLQENESFFYAELKRLHLLIQQYEEGKQVFFLLDEILKGTNSKDQHAGSEALIKKILQLNGVGIVATHDVELSKLMDQFPNKVRNLRFEITIKDNKLNFDYKLTEGVCSTMNASFLMKKMGIVD
jgi:DNA mismatch repair ATPase MutS